MSTLQRIKRSSAIGLLAITALAGGCAHQNDDSHRADAGATGLVSVPSNADAATTFARLRAAVQANPALKIVAELDHAANAARVGMELPPTRLLIFGNPALGTPLMRAAQTTAIDLPQKMLVYTDASGRTFVVYNDPAFLARRHGAKGVDDSVGKIGTALGRLAAAAGT